MVVTPRQRMIPASRGESKGARMAFYEIQSAASAKVI
jgi:hypothetical protein